MILAIIILVVSSLRDLGGGLMAGLLAAPVLELLAQAAYRFLDSTLP